MATESPIRMVLPRGKWSSLPGTGKYMSAPISESTDENRVLARSQYQSERCNAPNRSGSAPPSMEGSFASLENLMHSVRRPSSLIDGCNNSLNLPWGLLPTHKEESEDDKSPRHVHNDWTGRSTLWSTQNLPVTRQRGIVDKKLGDLSHTPPISDQRRSLCSESAGVADHNAASDLRVDNVTSSHDDDDTSDASASRSISRAKTKSTVSPGYNDDQSSEDNHKEDGGMAGGASEITSVQSGIKALKMSPASDRDIHCSQEEQQPIYQDSSVQHQPYQQNNVLQFQNLVPQTASQVMSNAYIDTNHICHLGKISAEVQPVFQSSGTTPTLHAAPASYLPSANPYYPGMQLPGVMCSPQYGLGGYGFNPMMFPPYLPGYPPHSAVPYNFNSVSVPQYNPQTPGVSPSNHADTENLSKFYGQHIDQHSFANPHMPFFPPYGDLYVGQVDPLAYSPSFSTHCRGQGNTIISNERPDFSGASAVHRPLNQGASGSANLNQGKNFVAPGYFRGSTNVGVLQIPTSNLPGPILPSSPIGGTNLPYGRNELSSPRDSSRSVNFYAGWTGQRGYENQNHTKPYSFLEELKSGKGRRLQISDVVGHVVEFSVDQHGSRFIQQKLENCSPEDKASVFMEVLPHASKLMTDVFGNYVIQKFFEYGMPEQRKELANQLQGQILPLSLQMYGCRVIQKALEVVEPEQKVELVHELDGHVLRCVRDQNGNHVIQKCIETIPIEKIDFIMSAFRGQVATLSMHPYGCRVIQRVLEHCADGSQSQFIVDEILESVCTLAQNQYGNYVTQHVLARGKPRERIQIIRKLAGQVVKMSQHKFASNVVEKCLKYGDSEGRELIIDEIIGINESNDNLLIMMKDQYANYVVQKTLEVCTDSQRESLLERIKVHLNALRKYTYGKHIVARFEQLFGQDREAYGSVDS